MSTRRTLVLLMLALLCGGAQAQVDPRGILWEVIRQLQTGTPVASWYGPQLWQVIAIQTGNSGIYPQLVALGPVQSINIDQSADLPNGTVYRMTANHNNGKSTWNFGVNRLFNRIEYANFETGNAVPPVPIPSPNPTPNPGGGTGNPGGASTSDACKKFPNLC